MNKNIMSAYEKLEQVAQETGNVYQWENIEHKMIPASYYDDKDGNSGEYIIPQERVECDLQKLTAVVMDFYQQACQNNDFASCDDFVTFFAAYCNFYIKKGFVCRLKDAEDRMFGLRKSDFVQDCDGKLLPYMQEIFSGIYTQDYLHFVEAEKIIPSLSVAHLYLFVFFTTEYYYESQHPEHPENQKDIKICEKAMDRLFDCLPTEYQEYVLGTGDYHREPHFGQDENILPYLLSITSNDIFRRNLETYCRKLVKDLDIAQKLGKVENPLVIGLNFTFIKDTLNKIDNPQFDEIQPFHQIPDWTAFPPIGRYAGLHICNLVPQGFFAEHFILSYTLRQKNTELEQTKQKLEEANQAKITILNSFSHNCKYLQSEALDDMAKSLLQMPQPEMKEYGGRILMEYGSKTDLVKEVKMMQLQFQENDTVLREKIRESIPKRRGQKRIALDDMLCTALRRCMLSLFYLRTKYDDGSKEYTWKFCFADKNIDEMRKSAEKTIVFSGDTESVKAWYQENLFPLEIQPYSEDWKALRLIPNSYASVMIVNLLTELFYNIFKYADKNAPVCFMFSDTPETLDIILINKIGKVDRSKIDSTKLGLSITGSLKSILSRTGQPIEHHAISPENTQYLTKISLDRTLFFK